MHQDISFEIYGDFNCPFCYTLNERIHLLGLEHKVRWYSIEHMPDAVSRSATFAELAELTLEVNEVRRLTPGTEIYTPSIRPNSGYAATLLAQINVVESTLAAPLRRQLYRMLWVDGLDISDPKVVDPVLLTLGLDGLQLSEEAIQLKLEWQSAWEDDCFKRTLPVLIPQHGETLLGIPDQSKLDAFLLGEKQLAAADTGAACVMGPRYRLLILDNQASHLQLLLQWLQNYQLIAVASLSEAVRHIQSDTPPELILINMEAFGIEAMKPCVEVISSQQIGSIPLVLLGQTGSASELMAFEAGAADFIGMPLHPLVLQARIKIQFDIIRSHQLLERMARLDGLTEVSNRREFDLRLSNEWERALRVGTTLSLLMIDIDYFKAYNDGYGHGRGDDCLRSVAQALYRTIQRPSDLLARYGGEEFAAVLPETGREGAIEVAERCLNAVRLANIDHAYSGASTRLTISIGVASMQAKRGGQVQPLLDKADQALYKAKQAGRNRLVFLS